MNTIIIGNQEWYQANSNETHFSNGDKIAIANNFDQWLEYFESGQPCAMLDIWNGNSSPFYFYNGFAASDSRGIGSDGFRVPTQEDFLNLISSLDQENGCPELRIPTGWEEMFNLQGNNQLNYNAKFVGHIDFDHDSFQSFLWTSDLTEFEDGDDMITAAVYFTFSNLWYDTNRLGLPIRLVRDLI